jgi:hypothetical protein
MPGPTIWPLRWESISLRSAPLLRRQSSASAAGQFSITNSGGGLVTIVGNGQDYFSYVSGTPFAGAGRSTPRPMTDLD